MNTKKYKMILLVGSSILLLSSCNTNISSTNPIDSSQNSIPSETTSSSSFVDEYTNEILHKELVGYDSDDFKLYDEGFSGDKFDIQTDSIRLLRDDSFFMTPRFDTDNKSLKIELVTYLGGLNTMGSEFVGETFSIRIEALDTTEEDSTTLHMYDVVDSFRFSHVLTQDDLDNGFIPLFPPYSENFEEDPFVCYLNGNNIDRIAIVYELEPFVNNVGSNLYLHDIRISGKPNS